MFSYIPVIASGYSVIKENICVKFFFAFSCSYFHDTNYFFHLLST